MSEWNGVPLNPEQDGWHWLCHDEIDQEEAALWNAKGNFWQLMGTDETFSPRDLVVRKWGYLGPVLMPDEVVALESRIAELEAALTTALQAKDTAHIRAAHILVAVQECNRPSEEIIREDRDSWPDHQANNPIRAALKGGKDD